MSHHRYEAVRLDQYRLTLDVDVEVAALPEEARDAIAQRMQASMDRLLLEALYGGSPPVSIEQSSALHPGTIRRDD